MLDIKSVSFAYQSDKILDAFSAQFKEGEITSVVGKSGVGKSTLFALLSGELKPQEGSIYLNEEALTAVDASKRPVITMFQQESLFPHMTLYENIRFPLITKYNKHRFKNIDHKGYIDQKLAEVSLAGFGDRFPDTLSGGQKQRATLARSLAANPKVLLLDEPFSALNEDLKYGLNIELLDIIKRNNIIALKITHDLNEAMSFSDNILYLDNGFTFQFDTNKLSELSAPAEVIRYFQLGILTENDSAYYPMASFTEYPQEHSFSFDILTSIKRGQCTEYALDHKGQRLKYISEREYEKIITLYLNDQDKISVG